MGTGIQHDEDSDGLVNLSSVPNEDYCKKEKVTKDELVNRSESFKNLVEENKDLKDELQQIKQLLNEKDQHLSSRD